MSPLPFYITHLLALFLFVGVSFAALAAPAPERRRQYLIYSGILSLVIFLTGFGLLGVLRMGVPGWAIVKILCLIVLAALIGVTFRRPGQRQSLTYVTGGLVLVALIMVYAKPF